MSQPPYLYETHLHTAETSRCGWMPAAHNAGLYAELGYTGMVVTDHLHETYIQSLGCGDDWHAAVERYLAGYHAAKEAGARLGLDVLLGAELRFEQENTNDYLLYGIDEDFLYRNPFLYRLGREAFFARYGKDILIIQAHPFRNGNEAVYPSCIHGAEVVNGSPRHKNDNAKTFSLCEKHPELLRFCGSDMHRPGDAGRCAMAFTQRLKDSAALREAVIRRDYTLRSAVDASIIEESNRFIDRTRG